MPSHAWQVKTAEEIGAHHLANGMPREDAVAVVPATSWERATGTVSVAVADGHGHARHFRSEHGSAIAVDVATRVGGAFGRKLAAMTDARAIETALRAEIGPAVVGEWRDTVIAHLDKHPVTDDEFSAAGLARNATVDELIFGYGATLLVAVAAGKWLAFLQIGDGDLFVVGANGRVTHPLPIDPRLDGLRTTSLCQPDALQSMRYAAVDATADRVGAVMMATDGYGNAQVRNDWEAAFGQDLAALAAKRGVAWIGDQLQSWVAQCASSDGSGDDVTAALMFATDAKWGADRDADTTLTISNEAPAEARTEVLSRLETAASDLPTTRQLPTVPPAAPATPAPRAAAAARLPGAARHRAVADEERTVVDASGPAATVQISADTRSAPRPTPSARTAPIARPAAATTTSRNVVPPPAVASPAPSAPVERRERSRRAIWVLLLLIVVVIGVLVALITVMWQGSAPPKPAPTTTPTSVSPSTPPPADTPVPTGRNTQGGGLGGAGQASSTPPSTHN